MPHLKKFTPKGTVILSYKLLSHCIYIGKNIVFKGTKKECLAVIDQFAGGYIDSIF